MNTRWISLAGLVLLTLFSLVSCGPKSALAQGDAGSSLPTRVAVAGPAFGAEPAQPQTQTPPGNVSIENVKSASQDLAQKLGIPVNGITVSAIIGEEFSNIAFHCKATKARIAKDDPPAVISGFTILLEASGRRYEYHVSGQTVIFCRPLP